MQEIEVKARIGEGVERALVSAGCELGAEVLQDDTVYVSMPKTPGLPQPERAVLRLRQEDARCLLTLKKDGANELAGLEIETEVGNGDAMGTIILALGFAEIVRVRKHRREGEWQGCHVCLDRVEGLGSFIELEVLSESAHEEAVQDELWTRLMSLGIAPSQRITKGYDSLMLERGPSSAAT